MLLLLFEVTPREGHVDEYLETAAKLRPMLDALGGCLFIDRYRSLAQPRRILSFQVWRDEASLTRWRVHGEHHRAQTLGRVRVFQDYRLRVAALLRVEERDAPDWEAGQRSGWHDPSVTPRYIAVAESKAPSLPGARESYDSIYRPGEFAHVFEWQAGTAQPTLAALPGAHRLRIAEIERDYGMRDRAEAPQYFAPTSTVAPSTP